MERKDQIRRLAFQHKLQLRVVDKVVAGADMVLLMGVMGVRVVVDAMTLLEVMELRVKEITVAVGQFTEVQMVYTVIRVEVVEERDR